MSENIATTEAYGDNWFKRRLKFILCRLGLHDWSKWYKVQVHHMGEYPWDTWQHLCHADRRECLFCGKSSRRRHLCQYPIESLPPQGK